MIFQSSEGMRQVRLRLAACRMSPHGEITSDLPGGEWNISPTRHVCHTFVPLLRTHGSYNRVLFHFQGVKNFLCFQQKSGPHVEEEDVEGEEEEEDGDDQLFTSQHECPLVLQKVNEYAHCSSGTF